MAKKTETVYEPRERLDSELNAAIGEILSAEAEARSIIEQAQATVKSIELDAAAQERFSRDRAVKDAAAQREKAMADAAAKADNDAQKLVADAEKRGAQLFEAKRGQIDARAAELFKELRGK